jgi:CheY-like chemotaxis protein
VLDAAYAARHEELRSGEYALVAVSDSGIGMSRETQAKAFDPFFTTKEVGKGSGLGLSQVYGFIRQSGGHVTLYSELGRGTTVKLYLPRLANAEPAAASSEALAAPRRGTELVLLVEDDEDVRANAATMLRALGYDVVEASDGPAALRLLDARADVRLLFTDVGLPGGMNGRELALEVQRRRPGLPVLFTTGYARNAIVHHGRLDADVDLLEKPFTVTSLAAKLRRVLDDPRTISA